MILGFLFFIQTFLKLCKVLRTEKYKRYINILLYIFYYIIITFPIKMHYRYQVNIDGGKHVFACF